MSGNGNSGRTAQPAVLHLLQGNRSKRNPKDLLDEVAKPAVPVEAPDKPDWLDDAAGREWDQLIPALLTLGLVTRLDGQALGQYCEAVAEYQRFTLAIREINNNALTPRGGDVQTYRTGAKDLSIWRKLRNDAQRRADDLGRQFGLTPLARRGLKPAAPQGELFPNGPKDAAERFFT